jgi:hypothetical protein
MSFDVRRLRIGEVVFGGSGVALILLLFAVRWYAHGSATGSNGWHTIAHLRWLLLGTGVVAVGAVLITATQRTPALPVAAGVLTTVVGALALIWLVYRVLISPPGTNELSDVSPGAYLSLVAAAGVVLGGWWSIRDESPGRVPVPPPGAPGSSRAREVRPAPPAGAASPAGPAPAGPAPAGPAPTGPAPAGPQPAAGGEGPGTGAHPA